MAERGRMILVFFGAYLIAKSVLNLIIGFSVGNIVAVLMAVAMAALLFFGVKYANYIVPGILVFVVAWHLKDNITGFPGSWLYLLEAVVDVAVAVTTVFQPDIKAYFESKET